MAAKPILALAELTYVVEFSPPAFDLASRPTDVLNELYGFINPHFPIKLSNMRASGGPAVSDVVADVAIFGGNAAVSVTARQATLTFRQIKIKEDLDLCAEIISLAENALEKCFPDIDMHSVALSCTLSLDLKDSGTSVDDHIARVVTLNKQPPLVDFVGGSCRPSANLLINDSDADWRAALFAAPNRDIESILVVGCTVERSNKNASTVDDMNRLRRLIAVFMDTLDIATPDLFYSGQLVENDS